MFACTETRHWAPIRSETAVPQPHPSHFPQPLCLRRLPRPGRGELRGKPPSSQLSSRSRVTYLESTLIKVFILKNFKLFRINTYEKHRGEAGVIVNQLSAEDSCPERVIRAQVPLSKCEEVSLFRLPRAFRGATFGSEGSLFHEPRVSSPQSRVTDQIVLLSPHSLSPIPFLYSSALSAQNTRSGEGQTDV